MRRNSGFSVTEILIGSTILIGLSLVLSRFSSFVSTNQAIVRGEGTLSSLRQEMAVASLDIQGWFKVMKSSSNYPDTAHNLEHCLVGGGPNYAACPIACTVPGLGTSSITLTCGGISFDDTVLKNEAQGQRLSGIDLYDINGQQIAGPPESPYYLDDTGAPCPKATDPIQNPVQNRNCKYVSTGYLLINQTAQGSTQPIVSFVRKTEQTPMAHINGRATLAANYDRVVLGTFWRDPQGTGPIVGTILAYSGKLTLTGGACSLPELPGYCLANGSNITVVNGSSLPLHQQLCQVIRPLGPCSVGSTFQLPDLRSFFIRGASGAAGSWPAWPNSSPDNSSVMAAHNHPGVISAFGDFTLQVSPHFSATGNLTGPAKGQMNFLGNYASGVFGTKTVSAQIYPIGSFYPSSVSPTPGTALPGGNISITQVQPTATVISPTGGLDGVTTQYDLGNTETRPSNVSVHYVIRDDYL